MNRRELFKRLAGVGVVGTLGVGLPPNFPLSPVHNRVIGDGAGFVIGRAVYVVGDGLKFPKSERERLAKDLLWSDYRKRVERNGRPYTSPRWVHLPQDERDPYMFDREMWGYRAEAIERV